MSDLITSALLTRKIEYGDYDFIVTFFSHDYGKITALAKNARKSVKRFSGSLELFMELEIKFRYGKKKKEMIYLMDSDLLNPHAYIRYHYLKSAYASFFCEVYNLWFEEHTKQETHFLLLKYILSLLDSGTMPPSELSILFMIKFIDQSGVFPDLTTCQVCGIQEGPDGKILFSFLEGSVVCKKCQKQSNQEYHYLLSMGAVKQILWIRNNELRNLSRLRFSRYIEKETLHFLETLISYYLSKKLKSLKFLESVRR